MSWSSKVLRLFCRKIQWRSTPACPIPAFRKWSTSSCHTSGRCWCSGNWTAHSVKWASAKSFRLLQELSHWDWLHDTFSVKLTKWSNFAGSFPLHWSTLTPSFWKTVSDHQSNLSALKFQTLDHDFIWSSLPITSFSVSAPFGFRLFRLLPFFGFEVLPLEFRFGILSTKFYLETVRVTVPS